VCRHDDDKPRPPNTTANPYQHHMQEDNSGLSLIIAVHRQERTQSKFELTEHGGICTMLRLLFQCAAANLIIPSITRMHLNLVSDIRLHRRPTHGPCRRSQLASCNHSGGSVQVRLHGKTAQLITRARILISQTKSDNRNTGREISRSGA